MIPFLLIKVTSEVSLGYVFYLVCTRLNKQSFELVVLLEKKTHDCRIHPLGTKNVFAKCSDVSQRSKLSICCCCKS